MINYVYLYLLSPLHTGGTTQEGNLLGIARESHTTLPYIPSSTIRGRIRASVSDRVQRIQLFGPELDDIKNFAADYKTAPGKELKQLEQGDIWVGDGSILWLPVPSLSHGIVWISCPMLLERWKRFCSIEDAKVPVDYSSNISNKGCVYLKDAILENLSDWPEWKSFVPQTPETTSIKQLLVLPNQHCTTLIQMSLWRQVKIKLDDHKSVQGGFRYEEAIPPDTLMYFPWGITSQANGTAQASQTKFEGLLSNNQILQIGGQESLGRGFVQQWLGNNTSNQGV
jgi:CRISPR-associated protein Cmr4